MNRLEEQCEDPEKCFGYIYSDLQSIRFLMGKVIEYYGAKIDRIGNRGVDTN